MAAKETSSVAGLSHAVAWDLPRPGVSWTASKPTCPLSGRIFALQIRLVAPIPEVGWRPLQANYCCDKIHFTSVSASVGDKLA